ncbi:MAG: hypothetical protein QXV27_06635 [Candidatus Caldarchaeum sp.]
MAKAGGEIIKRLPAPELREIVGEELSTALQPFMIKMEEMEKRITSMVAEFDKHLSSKVSGIDKRLFSQISELNKRLSSQISELDKRLTSEISSLRSEVQYVSRVAVLETKLAEIEKRLTETVNSWRSLTAVVDVSAFDRLCCIDVRKLVFTVTLVHRVV